MSIKLILCILPLLPPPLFADKMDRLTQQALKGMVNSSSKVPYSKTIEKMTLGYDDKGTIQVGIAQRKIKTFKPITGVIVVKKMETGFIVQEAYFPDIEKIRSSKDRAQVKSILKMFSNQPFNPHAEKSAVDGLTGATKYGLRVSGYFNYMARKTALEMEAKPKWPKKPVTP